MKIFIYTDDDSIIELPDSFKKKIKIGDIVKINAEDYEVWYMEETKTHRNVRVERVNGLQVQS